MAVSAIGIAPILIVVGLFLSAGVLTAVLTGWINTIIYTLAGIGIVALWFKLSKLFGFGSWRYLLLFIIPLFALIGWGVNHTSYLTVVPNVASWVASAPTFTLYQNDLTGDTIAFVMNFNNFGALMSTIGVVLGVVSLVAVYKKPRRHR